jgi:hypothetical protein
MAVRAPISGSKLLKPVMLPPGRDRLATKPSPTGSATTAKMIGMVAVAPLAKDMSKIVPTMGHPTSRFNEQFLNKRSVRSEFLTSRAPARADCANVVFGQRRAFFGERTGRSCVIYSLG